MCFKCKGINELKVRGRKKRHAILGQKKAKVTMLVSDKVKNAPSAKDHSVMLKVLIHRKHITILNTDALNKSFKIHEAKTVRTGKEKYTDPQLKLEISATLFQ